MGFNGFMVYQITINSGNARLSQLGIYVRTLDRKKHADCYKIKQNQKKKNCFTCSYFLFHRTGNLIREDQLLIFLETERFTTMLSVFLWIWLAWSPANASHLAPAVAFSGFQHCTGQEQRATPHTLLKLLPNEAFPPQGFCCSNCPHTQMCNNVLQLRVSA